MKESIVRGWKNWYCEELKAREKKRSLCDGEPILQLPTKCQGRPLLIGDHLEAEVCLLIEPMQKEGTVVNTEVAIGIAIGVVSTYDANLFSTNGGPIIENGLKGY